MNNKIALSEESFREWNEDISFFNIDNYKQLSMMQLKNRFHASTRVREEAYKTRGTEPEQYKYYVAESAYWHNQWQKKKRENSWD